MQASLPSPNNVPRSCCLHLDLGYRESPASPTKRSVSVCVWYQWLYFLPVQREYLLVKTGICQSDGGSAWRYNGVLHPTGVPFINKPKLVHFVNKPKQLTQNIICIEVFIFIRVLIVLTWFKIQSQWFWKVWKHELCFWGKLWFDWSRVSLDYLDPFSRAEERDGYELAIACSHPESSRKRTHSQTTESPSETQRLWSSGAIVKKDGLDSPAYPTIWWPDAISEAPPADHLPAMYWPVYPPAVLPWFITIGWLPVWDRTTNCSAGLPSVQGSRHSIDHKEPCSENSGAPKMICCRQPCLSMPKLDVWGEV